MGTDKHKNELRSGPGSQGHAADQKAHAVGDLCRCKETALMKPRQLLKLMIDDLSFWKKKNKG